MFAICAIITGVSVYKWTDWKRESNENLSLYLNAKLALDKMNDELETYKNVERVVKFESIVSQPIELECRFQTTEELIDHTKDFEHISYLPPMRWDLFKKGRLAVKVTYRNYKEFYEACEKELGKKPSSYFSSDYTVSICKKDGCFEIFTVEHQKKTGKKIVDWEDVR